MKADIIGEKENLVEKVGEILLSAGSLAGNLVIFPGKRPAHFLRKYLVAGAVVLFVGVCVKEVLAAGNAGVVRSGPDVNVELFSILSLEDCDSSSRLCPPPSEYLSAARVFISSSPLNSCRRLMLPLKGKGLRRDTLARFSLSLTPFPELVRRVPLEQYHGRVKITDEELESLLDCLRRPENVTSFRKFYATRSRILKKQTIENAACGDAARISSAAVSFFGYSPATFAFIPAPLMRGRGAWGGSLDFPEGQTVYAVYGSAPGMYKDCSQLRAIARHEFAHGLLSFASAPRTSGAGPFLFLTQRPRMAFAGYISNANILDEYLARAVSILLAEKLEGKAAADTELGYYRSESGFSQMDMFVAMLREYDAGRDKYPDFNGFRSRMTELLERAELRTRLRAALAGFLIIVFGILVYKRRAGKGA